MVEINGEGCSKSYLNHILQMEQIAGGIVKKGETPGRLYAMKCVIRGMNKGVTIPEKKIKER